MDCVNYIKSNVQVSIEANRATPSADVPMIEEVKVMEQVEETKAIEEPVVMEAPIMEEFKEIQAQAAIPEKEESKEFKLKLKMPGMNRKQKSFISDVFE